MPTKRRLFHSHFDEDDYGSLEFDPSATLYTLTMSMARYFVEQAKGEYFVSMPTRVAIWMLGHIRGNDGLLMDMAVELAGIYKLW